MVVCALLTALVIQAVQVRGQEVSWDGLNLPEEHLPYFFYNNKQLKNKCLNDPDCPFKDVAKTKRCWGYEDDCPMEFRMLYPQCFEEARSVKAWMQKYNAQSQEEVYWKQADFGFVKERRDEMVAYCVPKKKGDSKLECADYCRYCKGQNIYMDFRQHDFSKSSDRYSEHIFKPGDIGGQCEVKTDKLKEQGEHKSPLQSWYAEVQHFTSLDFHPIKDKRCDIIVDKPTVVMKLDAGVNMYHHFCDYLNLYLSQHANNNFDRDINIINWDTSYMKYGDFFSKTWEVFTNHPVKYLKEYAGKRVCFKEIMFPFLARMRYGLYYNTPIISGCKDTGLFRAFQQHVLHRLGIEQRGPLRNKIRVTLLHRGTKFRKILNQDEIYQALNEVGEYEVTMVNYNSTVPFQEQIRTSHNSDIFMGMHGSGLTHSLFQPDWGALFEIYNCDDVNCYKDLAHLRGLKYFTWEKPEHLVQEDEGHHPTLGAHKKFTNYTFNVDEFKRMVAKMADHVRRHPAFRAARRQKYGSKTNDNQTKDGKKEKEEL